MIAMSKTILKHDKDIKHLKMNQYFCYIYIYKQYFFFFWRIWVSSFINFQCIQDAFVIHYESFCGRWSTHCMHNIVDFCSIFSERLFSNLHIRKICLLTYLARIFFVEKRCCWFLKSKFWFFLIPKIGKSKV